MIVVGKLEYIVPYPAAWHCGWGKKESSPDLLGRPHIKALWLCYPIR